MNRNRLTVSKGSEILFQNDAAHKINMLIWKWKKQVEIEDRLQTIEENWNSMSKEGPENVWTLTNGDCESKCKKGDHNSELSEIPRRKKTNNKDCRNSDTIIQENQNCWAVILHFSLLDLVYFINNDEFK